MPRKLAALSGAVAAIVLAACAGHYGSNSAGNGSSVELPSLGSDLSITATLPDGKGTGTVSEELPSEGLGKVNDPFWKASLGGFTQQNFSQALGFPPGTKLTIKNISGSISHTFNVVMKIKGPPAKFPTNPKLSFSPSGGPLRAGYASGIIAPGKSVTVKLRKAGTYLFGCAFHYSEGMQDVIVVKAGATPGPQATAPVR
ncbi:MAG: plastocyanin/azurin family copper-binding protein [Candidatus Cybelea sp.]|jgi:plastocyanin